MYSPCDCIIIETNVYRDGSQKAHLFVVILEVVNDTDRTILFPIDTIYEDAYYDQTTPLAPGDHDFVKNPSYIDYSWGRIETKATLDKMISDKVARRRNPPVDQELFERICDGIRKSNHTPMGVIDRYVDHLFDQL